MRRKKTRILVVPSDHFSFRWSKNDDALRKRFKAALLRSGSTQPVAIRNLMAAYADEVLSREKSDFQKAAERLKNA